MHELKNVALRCCNSIESIVESEEEYSEVEFVEPLPPIAETESVEIADNLISTEAPTCDKSNNCPENEICVDSWEGFTCKCKSGFEKSYDGYCEDVDECDLELHNCAGGHGKCVNLPGSFKCAACDEGFELVGTECKRKCQKQFFNNDDCLCPNGYAQDEYGSCIDVDECSSDDACKMGEVCTNVLGGFRCTAIECPSGFKKHDQRA